MDVDMDVSKPTAPEYGTHSAFGHPSSTVRREGTACSAHSSVPVVPKSLLRQRLAP